MDYTVYVRDKKKVISMTERIQEKKKSAEEFIVKILNKISPETKQRIIDIIIGFYLAENKNK